MMNYDGTNNNNVHPLSKSSVTHTVYIPYFINIDSVLSIFTYTIGKCLLKKKKKK